MLQSIAATKYSRGNYFNKSSILERRSSKWDDGWNNEIDNLGESIAMPPNQFPESRQTATMAIEKAPVNPFFMQECLIPGL